MKSDKKASDSNRDKLNLLNPLIRSMPIESVVITHSIIAKTIENFIRDMS